MVLSPPASAANTAAILAASRAWLLVETTIGAAALTPILAASSCSKVQATSAPSLPAG